MVIVLVVVIIIIAVVIAALAPRLARADQLQLAILDQADAGSIELEGYVARLQRGCLLDLQDVREPAGRVRTTSSTLMFSALSRATPGATSW